MTLHRPWGATGPDGLVVDLTPETAGWSWTGLTVVSVPPGGARVVRTGPAEAFVLPLTGGVAVDGGTNG